MSVRIQCPALVWLAKEETPRLLFLPVSPLVSMDFRRGTLLLKCQCDSASVSSYNMYKTFLIESKVGFKVSFLYDHIVIA